MFLTIASYYLVFSLAWHRVELVWYVSKFQTLGYHIQSKLDIVDSDIVEKLDIVDNLGVTGFL